MCGAEGDSVCASLSEHAWVETAATLCCARGGALSTQPKEPSFVVRVTPLAAPCATHAVSASVGRSVSAGAKTGTTRTGWRAAGQGAWSTPALPPHVALPCPSSPFHSVPRRFFAFHGDKQARGLSCFWLASWPVRPSVRRLRHRAGRNIHSPAVGACMRADSPAGKDLDLTV